MEKPLTRPLSLTAANKYGDAFRILYIYGCVFRILCVYGNIVALTRILVTLLVPEMVVLWFTIAILSLFTSSY